MAEKKITIRPETKDDYRAVENLTREAFWNVYRPGCMEHYVLHCYRPALEAGSVEQHFLICRLISGGVFCIFGFFSIR